VFKLFRQFTLHSSQTVVGGPLPVGGLDHNPNIGEISIFKGNKTQVTHI